MKALAARVAGLSPGWTVRGATLAMAGSLEAALDGFTAPIIYPFFMAEGVFTSGILPERLRRLTRNAEQLSPFGVDHSLPRLMSEAALQGAVAAGLEPHNTTLLLAAHGSKLSSASKHSTLDMVQHLGSLSLFAEVKTGFIEETPFLARAAHALGPAICLPFFALRAGHVETDIPRELAEAGFTGSLLPAIGEHSSVPRLIAAALGRSGARIAA